MKKTITKILLLIITIIVISFSVYTGIRINQFSKAEPEPLSLEEEKTLQSKIALDSEYQKRQEILKPLPYKIPRQNLNVYAESAILINASNGNVLYEKNADTVIPPASMTKLFAMFVVDEEVSKGRFTYDQIISIPEESLACNMPPHSSLMFLGEGQIVTLEELILGLSICSGNDAAYALAYTVSGTMEAFVERMNKVARDLGLKNTHFVESSGYSELNTTTAREMAAFSKIYLERHPDSLERFHSVPSFTYPKEKNLAPGDTLHSQDFSKGLPRHITMSITQRNTNPLLGELKGCDGLKTGFINESGYNLSLTASRDGTRFISVTMKGPGRSSTEGQAGRIHDGTELMEWAFVNFKNYNIKDCLIPYSVKCFNGSEKMINLVPAFIDENITVPFIYGENIDESVSNVNVKIKLPSYTWGAVEPGEQLGSIQIFLDKYVIDEIPLVSDRKLNKSNFISMFADKIYLLFH